jgi:hypothetical protein
MSGKDRLDKVLAVAVNPGAYEQEAVAALHKARELIKSDPNLAFDFPSVSGLDPAHEVSFKCEISGISEFWLPILLNSLSDRAYTLRLRSKFICDFAIPTTVRVKCDGAAASCKAFEAHVSLLLEYIRSRQRQP